jgi:hypothetical protein
LQKNRVSDPRSEEDELVLQGGKMLTASGRDVQSIDLSGRQAQAVLATDEELRVGVVGKIIVQSGSHAVP